MLQEIFKEDTSPSFGSLRFSKLQIFVKMVCANSQSPVWSRHVGGALCSTNMAAGK